MFNFWSQEKPKIKIIKKKKLKGHYFELNDLLADYNNVIYKCNLYFAKDSSWWFTPISSREWYGSNLQKIYQSFPKILQFFEQPNNEFEIIYENEYQIELLYFFIKEYECEIKIPFILKIYLFFLPFIQVFLNIKEFISVNILLLILSFRTFSTEQNGNYDVVFFCPFHGTKPKINSIDIPFDRYFGDLPHAYFDNKHKTEILGIVDTLYDTKSIFNLEDHFKITPLLKYWRLRFYFKFLIYSINELIFSPTIKSPIKSKLPNIHKQINREIRKFYWNRLIAKAYQYSCKNYIQISKPRFVFHTYENNWWERAINLACKESSSIVKKQIGYLHCAILDSHMKYTILKDEWDFKPRPDVILVTGPEAKKVLIRRGSYKDGNIRVGYDLRGPNLYLIKQKANRPKKIHKVLVLLEGLNTMPKFLQLVMETIGEMDYLISVRCHPVFPIDKSEFKEIRNHKLYSQLEVTKKSSLNEDLEKADIVVYKGSTSALYAGYMGIPLLRFQDGWWASDDPLEGCNSFKKNFSNSQELLDGIQYFESMKDEFFEKERTTLQNYVFHYMRPYTEHDLEKLAKELIAS